MKIVIAFIMFFKMPVFCIEGDSFPAGYSSDQVVIPGPSENYESMVVCASISCQNC